MLKMVSCGEFPKTSEMIHFDLLRDILLGFSPLLRGNLWVLFPSLFRKPESTASKTLAKKFNRLKSDYIDFSSKFF